MHFMSMVQPLEPQPLIPIPLAGDVSAHGPPILAVRPLSMTPALLAMMVLMRAVSEAAWVAVVPDSGTTSTPSCSSIPINMERVFPASDGA